MAYEGNANTEIELSRKRGAIKAKLTSFIKFVKEIDEANVSSVHQLRLRIAKLQRDFESFESIQDALELIAKDEQYESRLIERCDFENAYYMHLGQAQERVEAFERSQRAAEREETIRSSTSAQLQNEGAEIEGVVRHAGVSNMLNAPITVTPEAHVQLPSMQLPKFNGAYEAWAGFADVFRSAIHDNPNFRDTQKLMYLRSCLIGKAYEKIESLETTAANYAVAWDILDQYYNDPSVVINKRIQAFFELPACTRSNSGALGELVDQAIKHYRALQALNRPFLEAFPIYAILSKLDDATRFRWRERTQGQVLPSVEELFSFLHARRKVLEGENDKISKEISYQPRIAQRTQGASRPNHGNNIAYAVTTSLCYICSKNHFTYLCPELKHGNIHQRIERVRGAGLCTNCLRPNHRAKECRASSCKRCNGKHHTSLHKEISTEGQAATQVNVSSLSANIGSETLLSTALIHVLDRNGQPQVCRVLLDSGSQSHFMTERAARRLGLSRKKVQIPVIGINQAPTSINFTATTRIQSRINNFQIDATFLIIKNITDTIPSRIIQRTNLKVPSNLPLADPNFNIPSEIDALIGAEIFLHLLCVGQLTVGKAVAMQKTKLGWILAGRVSSERDAPVRHCNLMRESVQDQIAKFWELEEPPQSTILSEEESSAEQHYATHTTRNSITGRYTVRLPLKEDASDLGQSYSVALKRFRSLEQKFLKNPELRDRYIQFLNEYIDLGHMTKLGTNTTNDGYYLPHHAVIKQNSLTTKLRVVFDASARASKGRSLNDIMLVGPTIQTDLHSLLVRFRSHTYVLTADIEKMYRQVLIHPENRLHQKILWRTDPNKPIETYTLNTITYGTSAAPFLAIRTLHQLAHDEGQNFPQAATILREDLYVDDMLTGADTRKQAIAIRDEITELCKKGGFKLRQWASNDKTLIETLDDQTDATHLRLDLDSTIKTLGIQWDAKNDTITYAIKELDNTKRLTKRTILAQIASLFDPLGLLGPIIVRAKMLMQQLWKLQLAWDESVPMDINTAWSVFRQDLQLLKDVTFKRQVTAPGYTGIQLHGFCDASERAYGACIYIRAIDREGNITTNLVSAKSRVAPLKTVTLPRLELCAAHLLSKLCQTTIAALNRLTFDCVILWSDSTVALHWIKTLPHTLKTFVAHRVSDIQATTGNFEWRHVPSAENPADLLSRGLSAKEFINCTLWSYGPSWLSHNEAQWPILPLDTIDIPERRQCVALISQDSNCCIFEESSSYTRLKRVIAYILRFRFNTSRKESNKGQLSALEIRRAELYIVRAIQGQVYSREINALNSSEKLVGNITSLSPFLDGDGILRVGGRLSKAKIQYATRHPILLPKGHQVTKLIIVEYHEKNFHAGTQATLNSIRQRFWITNGKGVIRNIIHKCVKCFRANPPTVQYKMGDLPANRVNFARPFKHVGVDFCGPMYIKEKIHRNRNKIKVYLAIFICFSTKAVHIEVVSDLTTDAFLAALRRFFARRGLSTHIYSDNATNFIGAKRELEEIRTFLNSAKNINVITNTLATEEISWHTIPPRSPHFGGLWEAAVRRAKYHLTRVIGDTLLSYEGLLTLTNQIEAILNSRPITPLSSDPNDVIALTPGHFLIGENLTSMPEYDLSATSTGRMCTWQHIQQMRRHFWNRWTKEYLQEQIMRRKWHTQKAADIPVGTLVIVKEDNLPPMTWPLGRITAVHPGDDGIVRVVTVKTIRGEYKRCVKKVSPLPIYAE